MVFIKFLLLTLVLAPNSAQLPPSSKTSSTYRKWEKPTTFGTVGNFNAEDP
jgi:hypothetical protein